MGDDHRQFPLLITHHYSRAGEPIVQELPVAIEERPDDGAAPQQRARQSEYETAHRVAHRQGLAGCRHEAYAPGFHRQRLSATMPLPHEIAPGEKEQRHLEGRASERGLEPLRERGECEAAGKQHRRQQQRFVSEAH